MKKTLSFILAILTILPLVLLPLSAAEGSLVEVENITNIHETSPYDDLRKFTYTPAPGIAEDGTAIPQDPQKEECATSAAVDDYFDKKYKGLEGVQLITIYEHAFRNLSESIGWPDDVFEKYYADYNIYFYFYIPDGVSIDTIRGLGSVRMRRTFDNTINGEVVGEADIEDWTGSADEDGTGYKDYPIEIVGGYEAGQKILKCRFVNPEEYFEDSVYRAWTHRRHDIIQVHLELNGSQDGQAYNIGASYICHNFREGYNGDCQDPYSMTCSDVAVLELEVEQTTYRTDTEDPSRQNDVTSVYFSVPESYFNAYGTLDSIKASWEEHHTTPIVVTGDKALYEEYTKGDLGSVLFKNLGLWTEVPTRALNSIWRDATYDPDGITSSYPYIDWHYNTYRKVGHYEKEDGTAADRLYTLAWFFGALDEKWGAPREVSREELLAYYYENIQHKDLLLSNTVDEGRKLGYQEETFYAKDVLTASDYKRGSIWEMLVGAAGFSKITTNNVIQTLDADAIALLGGLNHSQISDDYFIDVDDVEDFVKYAQSAAANNCRVVVLHFAETDYMAKELAISFSYSTVPNFFYDTTYMCTQTMFLDFTIINVQFKNDSDIVTIIPCVNTPTDIIGPAEPPPSIIDPGTSGATTTTTSGDSDKGGCAESVEDFKQTFAIILGTLAVVLVIRGVMGIVNFFRGGNGRGGGPGGFGGGGGGTSKNKIRAKNVKITYVQGGGSGYAPPPRKERKKLFGNKKPKAEKKDKQRSAPGPKYSSDGPKQYPSQRDASFQTGRSPGDPTGTKGSSFESSSFMSAALRKSYGEDLSDE